MRYIILLITILPLSAYTQQEEESAGSKFSLGINFSPLINHRILSEDMTVDNYEFYVDYRNDWEEWKTGFSTGFDFKYKLLNWLEIKSGTFISQVGYQIKERNWIEKGIYDAGLASYRYNYTFIRIPLQLEFGWTWKRIRIYVSAGVSGDYLIRNKLRVDIDNYDGSFIDKETRIYDRKDEPFWINPPIWSLQESNFYMSVLGGVGFEFELKPELGIRFEPNCYYGLTSTFQSPFKENLYGAGLNFGVWWKL